MRSATEAGRLASTWALRRIATVTRCPHGVAAVRTTSHGIRRAPECCVQRSSESLGSSLPPRRLPFPVRPRGLPAAAVPRGFHRGFILSYAFVPSRVSRDTTRPDDPGTSLGLPSLFATSTGGVHSRGRPRPASFRPRRFARPRRLAPLPALRVYFTPLPRPGFALQGFPLARSRTGSSPAVALLSFARDPCQKFYPMAPGSRARLQGFSPLANPSLTRVG